MYVLNCNNNSQYYRFFLLCFESNKCSLGEQKRLLLKTLNILQIKNFWLVLYALCVC